MQLIISDNGRNVILDYLSGRLPNVVTQSCMNLNSHPGWLRSQGNNPYSGQSHLVLERDRMRDACRRMRSVCPLL